jgi:hypothetical protein
MTDQVQPTRNEKVAKYLLSFGFDKPNCYQCEFFSVSKENNFRGTCTHVVADASRLVRKQAIDSGSITADDKDPYFPLIITTDDNGVENGKVPGVIAKEFGVEMGLVTWPDIYDPIYILFCMLYARKTEQTDY